MPSSPYVKPPDEVWIGGAISTSVALDLARALDHCFSAPGFGAEEWLEFLGISGQIAMVDSPRFVLHDADRLFDLAEELGFVCALLFYAPSLELDRMVGVLSDGKRVDMTVVGVHWQTGERGEALSCTVRLSDGRDEIETAVPRLALIPH